MRDVLTILLLAVLAGAVASFAVLGLRQHLRATAMARRAHELSLHFEAGGSSEVPPRYAAFALMAAGHSPRAENLTHGQIGGLSVRAFDFRYEVGHGPRRLTRLYGVIVVESPAFREALLMWNLHDLDNAPAVCRLPDGQAGGWVYRGRGPLAQRVAEACARRVGQGLSLEFRPMAAMLCFPIQRGRQSYMTWLDWLPRLAEDLRGAAGEGAEPPPAGTSDPPRHAVETPSFS